VEDGDAEADAAAASGITGFEDALLPADRFWEVAMSVIDTVQYIPRSDARYSEVSSPRQRRGNCGRVRPLPRPLQLPVTCLFS